ncbi:MAG: septum formation family protein [Kineosporiaceae bacterium]
MSDTTGPVGPGTSDPTPDTVADATPPSPVEPAEEPAPAPTAAPEPVAESAPVVEPEPVVVAEPEPEPVVVAAPEPEPVVEPEPVAAAEPEPAPVVEPGPVTEPGAPVPPPPGFPPPPIPSGQELPGAVPPPDYAPQGFPPPGFPPPQPGQVLPPQPAKGVDVVSILALVFALIMAPVGLVLGIVGLARTKGGKRGGRGLAIAGVALGALFTLVGVAAIVAVVALMPGDAERDSAGKVTKAETIRLTYVKTGDCIDESFGSAMEEVTEVKVVPCAQAHTGEVVDVVTLPKGPFPGNEELGKKADEECSARVTEEDLTDAALERDDLSRAYFAPGAADWPKYRNLLCLVAADEPVTQRLMK